MGKIVKNASAQGLPGMVNPGTQKAAKVIYILTVEDPSVKDDIQTYVCLKQGLRENDKRIEITGSAITSAKAKKITVKAAEELLGKTQSNVIIPWSRVVSIKNLTFGKAQ